MTPFHPLETDAGVDEQRAAVLTGLSLVRLRELARQTRLGRRSNDRTGDRLQFTYQELHLLCRLASGTNHLR
ncbi:MAG: hypothetical protein K6U02_09215 [Firmicutes bacterium]|nr:hypothetical protein [Bacillota bacterium]